MRELTLRASRSAASSALKAASLSSELSFAAFATPRAVKRPTNRTFASSALARNDSSSHNSTLGGSTSSSSSSRSSSSSAAYLLEQALKMEEEEERVLEAQKRARKPKELQEDAWDGDELQHRAIRRILEDQYKPLRVKVSSFACLSSPEPPADPQLRLSPSQGPCQEDPATCTSPQLPLRRPSSLHSSLLRFLNAERAVAGQIQSPRLVPIRYPYLRLFISPSSHFRHSVLLAEVQGRSSASAPRSSLGAIARLWRRFPTRRARRKGDGSR